MNIACWSGPRNLSTAMMYSFGARTDFDVWDEPFYAAYLRQTGIDHPMRAAVLATYETDADRVGQLCTEAAPNGAPHFYQKHMTHHMVTGISRDWFDAVRHVFLIRHPARVLASYAVKRENPTLADIGFAQQVELYQDIKARGLPTVVIDSYDIRQNPERALRDLCARLEVGFDPAMLAWPQGGHARDGIWAAHWYDAVHLSTGFAGPEGPLPDLPDELQDVFAAAMPYYETMKAQAL